MKIEDEERLLSDTRWLMVFLYNY